MAHFNGPMVPPIPVRFEMERPMEKVNLAMQTAIHMKVISSMIRLMDSVSIFIMNKCKSTKVNGKMICNTVMEEKNSATIQFTKVILFQVKSMVKESTFGLIPQFTRVSGRTMR